MLDYFPLGTASGKAFCNRKQETEHLLSNIKLAKPTLIMSSRRFGKTSLALHTFNLEKMQYVCVDLYKELSGEDVEKAILNGVGELLGKIETKPEKLIKLAKDFFSNMHINVTLHNVGISIEQKERKKDLASNIQEVLVRLQELAAKRKKKVLFFIDEFQKLAEIHNSFPIEAAIRHAAQFAKNVSYVFSGSNRHLLQDMFFDKNRPFYKLCDTLYLKKIEANHYKKYIQNAAKKRWGKVLSEASLEAILNITERHPYYINYLCSKLWLRDLPNEQLIYDTWKLCSEENKSQIEREVDLLSFNQRRLLISIAKLHDVKQPTNQEFIAFVNMSSASIAQALSTLIDKDYLYQDEQGFYRLLDPLFSYTLK